MHLAYIKIENYKGIEVIETEFDPKLNIIIGVDIPIKVSPVRHCKLSPQS